MDFNESFYKDPYRIEGNAEVISCEATKKGYGIVFDDTLFYPEGGGQPADRGFLRLADGTEISVRDVRRDKTDRVLHYTDTALEPGTRVGQLIDFDYRFSLMQNHSGEHIVSGLIKKNYGYENVGFHMSDVITIDISGELSWEQAMDIEQKANAVIWKNIRVDITLPNEASIKDMDYRSKKELSGQVRLVGIEDTDLCACCGLHVSRTGEIGIIKLLSLINYKGGVRIEMVCGAKALKDYEAKLDSNTEIKNLLSVKPHEVTDAVKHVLDESAEKSARIAGLSSRYFDLRVKELEEKDGIIFAREDILDGTELRKLCEKLKSSGKATVSVCLLPLPGGEPSFRYVIASTKYDLKSLAPALNKALNGKGGGSKEMIQGSFNASYDKICEEIRGILLLTAPV
ncbi:MAG: alanyl-tRNA editing protein [Lachnospiraceae bacterium]|nr:alanyl-tRNA editing protein [Lachnospiraceae bacterium]